MTIHDIMMHPTEPDNSTGLASLTLPVRRRPKTLAAAILLLLVCVVALYPEWQDRLGQSVSIVGSRVGFGGSQHAPPVSSSSPEPSEPSEPSEQPVEPLPSCPATSTGVPTLDTYDPVEDKDTAVPGDGISTLAPSSGNGTLLSLLLPGGKTSLSSPNGAYTLTLQPSGDLVLTKKSFIRGDAATPVWWTGTGDYRTEAGHTLTLSVDSNGAHARLDVNAKIKGQWQVVWHSNLEPACKNAPISATEQQHGLELSDTGLLRLSGQCDLYIPPQERGVASTRSLAVLVSGLYRTHNMTCPSHIKYLIGGHPSFARIDVFAFILYEDKDLTRYRLTPERIEADVRACYGEHLRSLTVRHVNDVAVDYPGGNATMLSPCGSKLTRLHNQLRTLAEGAKLWWSWSLREGMLHDTILRIRTDTNFYGQPTFWGLEELGHSTLVLPHPRLEHYFYCARMSGRVGVGPSDQLAYGSPAAMGHWLHMVNDFTQMIALAANPTRPAMRDISGCEDIPTGPLPGDCLRPVPCAIECLVAWYLEAKGVQFHVEWGWEQHNLRPGGFQPELGTWVKPA